MSSILSASDPQFSATVNASAGTGKTWLLVTRMVRLLLDGARPDGLLAITFTRKAAAEMQTRLRERLLFLARADEQELVAEFAQMGVELSAAREHAARGLYEALLRAPRPLRTTTFHAFCQDVLRRFPLEADIAPGFELLDATRSVEQEALAALYSEATTAPDAIYGRALESMFDHLGADTAEQALFEFLAHRSDWWVYTADAPDPVAFANEHARQLLAVDPLHDPIQHFIGECRAEITEFIQLLQKHRTQTNAADAARLSDALLLETDAARQFSSIKAAFLTQKDQPRARAASKAQAAALGAVGEARLLELHAQLCARILEVLDQLRALQTLAQTCAWQCAGARLLEHYQRIKSERRWLDFTDLEWNTYALLNHSDNAHWVQYKLDQRIEHLLIDEFQDTNPVQWRMLLPLLQEFASGQDCRARSVFLVGDSKQSIYRFRRADARLFETAQHWLHEHLHAQRYSLDQSRRSARAIIDCVNTVFDSDEVRSVWQEFPRHTTHHEALWGRVELLPLIEESTEVDEIKTQPAAFRNPLLQPRIVAENTRHRREGEQIAQRIQHLMAARTVIGGTAHSTRPLQYGDITILVRSRTHLHAYEAALRAVHIPYLSANRGRLLECLEIRDLVALLETLITPFDNLALAGVLRSPLFSCSDDDLMLLARIGKGSWMERLSVAAEQVAPEHPLRRACTALQQWRRAAERLPAHDLLDRIYCEGRVQERYAAAFAAHLRVRVRANLTRFIELALEVDSGRYPSVPNFLRRLRDAQRSRDDAPDEGAPGVAQDSVRLLTIHAAKGLEAPVIFLADAANTRHPARGFHILVNWPSHAARPECFLLAGKKAELDPYSRGILAAQQVAEQREDLNLLYVALTRAKQLLFISGCAPSRGEERGWYGRVQQQLAGAVLESGTAPQAVAVDLSPPPPASIVVDPRLAQPLDTRIFERNVSPSRASPVTHTIVNTGDDDAQQRGIAIHRMLDCMTRTAEPAWNELHPRLAFECGLGVETEKFRAWWQEAEAVCRHPPFQLFFNPDGYQSARNEVAISYDLDGRMVHGVMDRVVVTPTQVIVLDYKTQRSAQSDNLALYARAYHEQLQLYAEGVRRLWPERVVRAVLLFTACRAAVDIPVNSCVSK